MNQCHFYIKNYRFLAFIILLCFSISLAAQDPYFIRYGIEDGLPSEEVYDVEQDNKGRIWIATDRGVARYDGYKFQSFDKKDGLATNTILNMFKDSKGRMWFCGYDGSLSIWDTKSFTIINIHKNEKFFDTNKRKQWIASIFEQDSMDYIFQFSRHKRDSKWNSAKFSLSDTSLINYEIVDLKELWNQDGQSSEFSRINNLIKGNRHELVLNNTFTAASDQYLFYIDKYTKVAMNDYLVPNYNSKSVSTLYHVNNDTIIKEIEIPTQVEDAILHNGNLILGSWEGLIVINTENSYQSKILLNDRIVTGLLIDKEDNLWLSTQNDGLLFIPNFTRIKQLPVYIKDERSANVDVFQNHLVVSYLDGSGLEIIDTSLTKVFGIYEKSAIFYPGIDIDNDVAYTRNSSEISFVNNKFRFHPRMKSDGSSNAPSRICLKLQNGYYLRGASELSIYKGPLSDISKRIMKIAKAPYSAIQFSNGDILSGCVDGLYEIDGTSFDYKRIDKEKQINIGSRVHHILAYNDSLTLLSTLGDGLLLYENNTRKVIHKFEIANGLISNQVNIAYLENDSTIWAGTNFGLCKLNISKTVNRIELNSIDLITTKEGLYSNFISGITKWNDELWVATPSGINYFKSDELKGQINAPEIFIDSTVLINSNHNVVSNSILDHNENDLSFHFTGVTFRKPNNDNFYKYSLHKKNEDPDWLRTNNRSIQFTNLVPGDYTFLVNAKNNFNIWATKPASFKFCIEKHFTETIWFRFLSLIFIFIIGYLIYTNRKEALIKKEKQIQKLKEAELNIKAAELNALRNQMNPHFIYNALNSIQNFIFKDNPEKANYMLSRFGKLMRSSLELSKLEYISFDKEIDFIENYLELEKMRFGDKFRYNISIDSAIKNYYKIPPLLIQPIIENSIKHGFSLLGGNGIININFKIIEDLLCVVVSDNGKGYSQKDDRSTYSESPTALKIIKERIDLLNKVNAKISTFDIVPLYAEDVVTGTQVTLQIPFISKDRQL